MLGGGIRNLIFFVEGMKFTSESTTYVLHGATEELCNLLCMKGSEKYVVPKHRHKYVKGIHNPRSPGDIGGPGTRPCGEERSSETALAAGFNRCAAAL